MNTPAALAGVCITVNRLTEWIGRSVAWLCLLMMLVTCTVVTLRYGFGLGSIALQESVMYLHATVFMLGAVVAVKRDGHVRVDIFYRSFDAKTRAAINLAGGLLFMLPVSLFMLIWTWDYVLASWQIQESSADAGGLHAVYLLKTLIPVTAVLLCLQGLVEILQNVLRLLEHPVDEAAGQ